jgi:hypothetical protein
VTAPSGFIRGRTITAFVAAATSSELHPRLTKVRFRTGTTYSCVATYEGTNVEIIANEQGSFTTPSFVSFTDKERLIGEAAKNNAAMNPKNTVFDAK